MRLTAFARACAHYDKGELPQALAAFTQALDEQPGDVAVLYRSMLTLVAMRRYADCATWLQELLPHIDPAKSSPEMMAGFHYNLGVAYDASGQWGAADRCYRNALAFDASAVLPKINLGSNCYRAGKPDEGKQWHDKALLPPTVDIESRPARSFVKLQRGDYLSGFAEYESRWKLPQVLAHSYIPNAVRWQGKPLNGKHLLVVGEQGIGDTIFMSRYFPLIEALGGKIVLVCNPVLHRLFAYNFPNVRIFPFPGQLCRWWVPMMSLPFVFRTTLDTIPFATEPYLTPLPMDQPVRTKGFHVGYVSNGNPMFMADHDRSAPPNAFAPLLAMASDTLHFHDLSEAADKRRGFTDMADTAALVQHLDLVVTVDTAMFHLAASMGKLTWMLPMTSPTWFCGNLPTAGGENASVRSPWYGPWHRLVRRTRVDAWPEVMQRIVNDLNILTAKPIAV